MSRPRATDSAAARAGLANRGLSAADRAAVAAIVDQHQKMVFGFLRARLTDPSVADDLCQEVFLRFLTSRPVVATGCGEISAWLVGIARNVLREHARRRGRQREAAWTLLCLDVEDRAETVAESGDERLLRLPACLEALGKTARTALDLHYGERLKLADIGRRFARSEGSVKLLLFRARQAVRRCLDANASAAGEEDGDD